MKKLFIAMIILCLFLAGCAAKSPELTERYDFTNSEGEVVSFKGIPKMKKMSNSNIENNFIYEKDNLIITSYPRNFVEFPEEGYVDYTYNQQAMGIFRTSLLKRGIEDNFNIVGRRGQEEAYFVDDKQTYWYLWTIGEGEGESLYSLSFPESKMNKYPIEFIQEMIDTFENQK